MLMLESLEFVVRGGHQALDNVVGISEREWKEFFISGLDGIFNISSSKSGIDKNKISDSNDYKRTPYITRTDTSNGISMFIDEQAKELDDGNCITIGLDTQTVFYQDYPFYTGQNIQVLRYDEMSKESALFITAMLKVQMEKFNWGGNGATLGRLSRTKIMLPVTDDGKPDYEFMEQYGRKMMVDKYMQYLKYAQNR